MPWLTRINETHTLAVTSTIMQQIGVNHKRQKSHILSAITQKRNT